MSERNMDTIVDSVYNFDQKNVEAVFERQKSRRAKGKIIINIEKSN